MENDDLKFWLAFSQIRSIGAVRFQKLINGFPDLETAWRADSPALMAAGLEEKIAQEIIISRSQINPELELEKLAKENLKVCLFTDDDYPPLLKQIFDPPAMLYYQGSLECLKNYCVAVVGTRKFSRYGQQAVGEIAGDLARQNITIVSGLALGIDALAHQACLENHGLTTAILGAGADWPSIYPSANRYLAKKIIENGGAVISEYPIGTEPFKSNFPLRNRIISGLALGVLIIEAKESSGSLITAKYALDQNREIFAVPGSIYSLNSKGTNNLIKQGARLTTAASDILAELDLQQITQTEAENKITAETPEEEIILNFLSKTPIHIDKLSEYCKLKINALSSALTILEMKGAIKDLGGKNYIKN